METLDDFDRKILVALQKDGRLDQPATSRCNGAFRVPVRPPVAADGEAWNYQILPRKSVEAKGSGLAFRVSSRFHSTITDSRKDRSLRQVAGGQPVDSGRLQADGPDGTFFCAWQRPISTS